MTSTPKRRGTSIRFQLTAWYAALLMVVLIAVAVSVLRLAENRLLGDMDARLYKTADDIAGVIDNQLESRIAFSGPVRFDDVVPELGAFTSRGLLVQIVDNGDRVVRHSEAAPTVPLIDQDTADSPTSVAGSMVTANGWRVRTVDYPLLLRSASGEPRPIGSIIVGERMDTYQETLDSLRQALGATSAAGLVLAIIGGWLLASRALRPVDRIIATAASVAVGEGPAASLGHRLDVPASGDELARLAETFNAMLDRLQAAFLAQRRFVADASHELRTPLAAIRGNTDVLARQVQTLPTDAALRTDLLAAATDMQRETRRMARLLDDLLLLARNDAAMAEGVDNDRFTPVRLDQVARDAMKTTSGLASGQHLYLQAAPVTVRGDRDKLEQVALVLLDNALRHTAPGNSIHVVVRKDHEQDAILEVQDSGAGIAPTDVPHVFDRFFRADQVRGRASGGSGLGLAIAKAIAEAHQGRLTVESAPGLGSVFQLRLPQLASLADTTDGLPTATSPGNPSSSGRADASGAVSRCHGSRPSR